MGLTLGELRMSPEAGSLVRLTLQNRQRGPRTGSEYIQAVDPQL